MLILSTAMVLVFLGCGCVLLFTHVYADVIPPPRRGYIGAILIAWGLFRIWSVFRNYQRSREEDEN